jgi:hypothetical protein
MFGGRAVAPDEVDRSEEGTIFLIASMKSFGFALRLQLMLYKEDTPKSTNQTKSS